MKGSSNPANSRHCAADRRKSTKFTMSRPLGPPLGKSPPPRAPSSRRSLPGTGPSAHPGRTARARSRSMRRSRHRCARSGHPRESIYQTVVVCPPTRLLAISWSTIAIVTWARPTLWFGRAARLSRNGGGLHAKLSSGDFQYRDFRCRDFPSCDFPSRAFPSRAFPSRAFPSRAFPSRHFHPVNCKMADIASL